MKEKILPIDAEVIARLFADNVGRGSFKHNGRIWYLRRPCGKWEHDETELLDGAVEIFLRGIAPPELYRWDNIKSVLKALEPMLKDEPQTGQH